MADAKLTAVIEAEDKASAVLSKVGNNAAGLGNKIKDLGPVFKGMAVAGTVAFGAISAIAISSFKASADAQAQMISASKILGTTLENMSDKAYGKLEKAVVGNISVHEDLMNKMKETGKAAVQMAFDDEEASVSFAKLFQITGDASKAQEQVKLAMDLSRFSGKDLSSSVSALIKVHAGGTKVLKEFGLEVKEGTTAQDAFGIVASRVGGQARVFSESTAGALERMKIQSDNLKESIGDALAPAFTALMEKVSPIIERFTAWAEQNPDLLAKILLIGGAIAGLVAVLGTLGVILPSIIAFFGLLSAPVLLVIGIIGALVFAVMQVVKIFQLLQTDSALVWEGIKMTVNEKITAIKNTIMSVMNAIKAVWEFVWGGIKTFFSDVWKSITSIADAAMEKIKNILQPIINMIDRTISKLNQLGAGIKSTASKAGDFLIDKVGGSINKALGINDGIVQNGKIITTHPDDYIMAAKDPSMFGGGGKNINIQISGAVLSQEAARTLGDMIINDLRLQFKF